VLVQNHPPEDPTKEFVVTVNSSADAFEALRGMGIRCFSVSTAVENVTPNSPGAAAGVKPGFNIVRVGDCRGIVKPDDVVLQGISCEVAFRRNQYDNRGWCAFERKISEMITPATMLLDLGHVMRMMEEWGCAGDLETFITKYKGPRHKGGYGGKKNPETWEEFVQMEDRRGGIAINLLNSRPKPPADPDHFDELLETLVFTNGAKPLVSKKYRKTFERIFQSNVQCSTSADSDGRSP